MSSCHHIHHIILCNIQSTSARRRVVVQSTSARRRVVVHCCIWMCRMYSCCMHSLMHTYVCTTTHTYICMYVYVGKSPQARRPKRSQPTHAPRQSSRPRSTQHARVVPMLIMCVIHTYIHAQSLQPPQAPTQSPWPAGVLVDVALIHYIMNVLALSFLALS